MHHYLTRICVMCLKGENLMMIHSNEENEIYQQIKYVLPELKIMEEHKSICICATCGPEINSFYKFKTLCMENACLWEHYINKLKEASNALDSKYSEMQIILNDNEQLLSTDEQYIRKNFEEHEIKVIADEESEEILVEPETFICFNTEENDEEPFLSPEAQISQEYFEEYGIEDKNKITGTGEKEGILRAILTTKKNENFIKTEENAGILLGILTNQKNENFIKISENAEEPFLGFEKEEFQQDIFKGQLISSKNSKRRKYQQLMNSESVSNTEQNYNYSGISDAISDISHNNQYNKSVKYVECLVCKKKFKSNYINQHITFHSSLEYYRSTCCSETIATRPDLNRYIKIHLDGTDKKNKSKSKKITTNDSLEEHLIPHREVKSFECTMCYKSFTRKYYLDTHIKLHLGIVDYKCPFCEKIFKAKSDLTRHMKQVCGPKEFECSFCHLMFSSDKVLNNHLLTHTGIREFKCPDCDKAYFTKASLKRHSSSHLSST